MINRIQIENFKSIREIDLELRPINILIGANGAGKSNFIGFFDLLKKLYDRDLQDYIADEAGAENILYFGSQNSAYLRSRIEFDKTNAYYFTLMPNKEGYFSIREGTEFHRDWYALGWDKEELARGNKESVLKYQDSGRYKYVNQYMKSFRIFHFHDTSKTAKIKKVGDINDNSFLRGDGSNLAAYLYLMQEKYPKTFKKIEMVIRSVAPYFDGFKLQPDRINNEIIRLEWKEKGSDAYFNARHFSDGTLRFIALATLLLQPEAPEVIIIDEPELGLHPFAIDKLAGLIKKASAQTQIIVSTQSVNLVDNFDAEDIITVDRKDNQSIFQRQNSEFLKDWLLEYDNSVGDLWTKNVIGGRP